MKRIDLTVELDNGKTHDISVANPSLVAWDRTRAIRKFPEADQAPIMWMTFIAWHHMKAAGLVKCDYPEFEEQRCLSVGDTVKPLTKTDETRLAELRAADELTPQDRAELASLVEREELAEPDEDPTRPAPEPGSSSS